MREDRVVVKGKNERENEVGEGGDTNRQVKREGEMIKEERRENNKKRGE